MSNMRSGKRRRRVTGARRLVELLLITAALTNVMACDRHKLEPSEAEKLLVGQWSARLGVGSTSCRMVFATASSKGTVGSGAPPLALSLQGTNVTIHGADAGRCARSLGAGKIIGPVDCQETAGEHACAGRLNEHEASARCAADSPCDLLLSCGSARIADMSVTTEERHATMKFKVVNTVTTAHFDGCPDSPKVSDDRSWTAKASLDDSGHWSLDETPKQQ
ncbi:MAG: hypothetical protein ABJE95_18995 [Byssovorax sp.]